MSRGRPRAFDREAALKSAMHVFWERGYEGTSITELTEAMGINSPSLYAAFGGKEALFREAVTLYGTTAGSRTERALVDQPTARASIEAMLRDNIHEYRADDHPSGCMVILSATNYTAASKPVHDHLADLRRDVANEIRKRVARGVDDGELPPETDAAALGTFYTVVLNGLSILARDGASFGELSGVVDVAMANWPPERKKD
ncbi:DNA-binding transcriptional regulator, AcrR family [Amycolatopsis xylanica]|uniref:DNA-binding transcriptional regulator, AcrR family n=1 Tax=Amycolatopsis xylanica TaxID=589385 RepID=A0A1H3LNG4_9PSEU|nr:TetR/AcrR family transcriptional regulator [Amycolatopsis xylanica]SDY65866.1 DNA-binding transcriptional regulator, AcrR family [Amycolatopsis xylanica]